MLFSATSTIFQSLRGRPLYLWRKLEYPEKTTDPPLVNGKLYHIMLYRTDLDTDQNRLKQSIHHSECTRYLCLRQAKRLTFQHVMTLEQIGNLITNINIHTMI